MSSLDWLLQGFVSALTPINLVYGFVGCFLGTAIGVLPGLGATSTIALLLPLTAVLPADSALIMMAAIYYGAMYGGSTTAIAVNIPGEAASVPTAMEGYKLAQQGRAGPALSISAISSFVAGTLGVVGLSFFAPFLAGVALAFGPPEYFALMFVALSLVISLSGKALLKGLIAALLGLLVSTIGIDPLTGVMRLTFKVDPLMGGIDFISVIIGLFAISEIMLNIENAVFKISHHKIGKLMPSMEDLKYSTPAIARSSIIGFFLGLLPGCSPAVTAFVAYDVEKRTSKRKHLFGNGAIEGVAATEGANNATCSGGFVPLFAFGIPSGPALAVLLGGFMMYGLQPGPTLFQNNPQLVWTIIASMYIGNIILLILNLPLVGLWARIATVPFPILGPLMIVFCILGAYGSRYAAFDVWMALIFGVLGYFMRKLEFPLAPMVLATVLAKMLETSLVQTILLGHGSLKIVLMRPLSATLIAVGCLVVIHGIWSQFRGRSLAVAEDDG